MSWIQPPVILEGNKVRLEPLASIHFPALLEIAEVNKDIWTYLPVKVTDGDLLLTELKSAMAKRATGEQYPFVIIDNITGRAIGSTRLLNIFAEHRKVEIGWTWYDPAHWGTGHNMECKYLLLNYCFDTLKCIRVQLQATEKNERSRAAIQKTGAKLEGILRNDRVRPDGTIGNTAVYSIIQEEWEAIRITIFRDYAN